MTILSSAPDDLLALEARRTRAMVDADIATLDALLIDGCRYVHSNGLIDTKETYLEKLGSGAVRYLRIDATDHGVLRLGATSVVTSRLDFDVTTRGTTRTVRIYAAAVWQRTEEGTRLAFFQATAQPPPA